MEPEASHGQLGAEGDCGLLSLLLPSPQSEAVTHEMEELSLQPTQSLPPLNERKNGEGSRNLSEGRLIKDATIISDQKNRLWLLWEPWHPVKKKKVHAPRVDFSDQGQNDRLIGGVGREGVDGGVSLPCLIFPSCDMQ